MAGCCKERCGRCKESCIGLPAEIIVLGCILAGLASNAAVAGTCDMIVITGNGTTGTTDAADNNNNATTTTATTTMTGSIGPFRANMNGTGCETWELYELGENFDWRINMGRVCSVIALAFGLVMMIFAFFNQCLCRCPKSQFVMDLSGVAVQICLALTWPMILAAVCREYGCIFGSGATALGLAEIFYLIASVLARCMREPRYVRKPKDKKNEANKVTKDADEKIDEDQP